MSEKKKIHGASYVSYQASYGESHVSCFSYECNFKLLLLGLSIYVIFY